MKRIGKSNRKFNILQDIILKKGILTARKHPFIGAVPVPVLSLSYSNTQIVLNLMSLRNGVRISVRRILIKKAVPAVGMPTC
eukprot:SAG31_NODE_199_length_20573_cov_5.832129_5_plen_82_part_00